MSHSADEPRSRLQRRHWANLIVTDVQFWIPVAVLIGGLLVLGWIS